MFRVRIPSAPLARRPRFEPSFGLYPNCPIARLTAAMACSELQGRLLMIRHAVA